MFSRSRLLFSLVAILFISTLALADSAPVSTAYFHSSAGVYGGAQSYSAHVTSNARTATPAIFTAFKSPSPSSYGETSIAHVSAQFSGNERFQVHGTVNRQEWRLGWVGHTDGDRAGIAFNASYSGTGQPDAAFDGIGCRNCRNSATQERRAKSPRLVERRFSTARQVFLVFFDRRHQRKSDGGFFLSRNFHSFGSASNPRRKARRNFPVSSHTHSRVSAHITSWPPRFGAVLFRQIALALHLHYFRRAFGGNHGNDAARSGHHRRSDVLAGRLSSDRRTHLRADRPRGVHPPSGNR
jgi:hypothetical protein